MVYLHGRCGYCAVLHGRWIIEPEDRCMQKPEYRAWDVAATWRLFTNYLQLTAWWHVWMYVRYNSALIHDCLCHSLFATDFWSRCCACLLQQHIALKDWCYQENIISPVSIDCYNCKNPHSIQVVSKLFQLLRGHTWCRVLYSVACSSNRRGLDCRCGS